MQDRETRPGPGGSLAPDSASLPSPRNPPEKRTSEGTAASAQKLPDSLRPPSLRVPFSRATIQASVSCFPQLYSCSYTVNPRPPNSKLLRSCLENFTIKEVRVQVLLAVNVQ